jgi:hypothetical protein
MGSACSKNVGKRNAYMIFAGTPEGKRPLRRPRRMWLDKVEMDLGEIELLGVIGLIWLRIGTCRGFK